MSRLIALLAALSTLWLAIACTDVDPTNPYDPGAPSTVQARATVSGRVLLETGEPAAGAAVDLVEASIADRTDDEGRFALGDVPMGSYTLTARLDGYATGLRAVLDLDRGETRDVGDLLLDRAYGGIRGELVFEGDREPPVGDVRLVVPGAGGVLELVPDPADGHRATFRLANVPVGTHVVQAAVPGYASDQVEGVAVAADADTTLSRPLRLVLRPVPVRGLVRLAEVATVSGVTVRFELGGAAVAPATPDETGAYSQVLPGAGLLRVVAEAEGRRPAEALVEVPLPPAPDAPAADAPPPFELPELLLVHATGRISGTVTVGGGLTIDPRTVRLSVDTGPAAAGIDATGVFEIDRVRVGERTVTASLAGFADATARITVTTDAVVTAPALVLEPVPVPLTVDVATPPGFAPGDTPLALTVGMDGVTQTVPVVDGAARFDAPHAGLLALSVTHPILARWERTVQIAPGAAPGDVETLAPITLTYAQGGLRGHVGTADCGPTGVAVLVTATGQLTGATAAVPVNVPGADTGGCGQGVDFELSGLRADDYLLTFTAEAYRPGVGVDAVRVREDTFAEAADVVLQVATGAVAGRVVVPPDAQDPAFTQAGTRVELVGTAFGATTDDAGEFRVEGVRPGVYAVVIRRDGETWQPLRLPSVSVRPLETAALGDLGLAFATGALTGRVELSTGEDPSTVTLSLSGPESGTANPDGSGTYQFLGRRTGTYRVTARHPDFTTAQADAVVSRHLETVELSPLRLEVAPAVIEGTVVFEPNALGTLPRVTVGETSVDVLADGSFRIDGLRRGTYTVTVDYPPTYRSKSLPGILASPGAPTVLGGITLDPASGSITAVFSLADEGRLSAAAARALRSSIQVSLNSQTGGLSYSSLADENGRVHFGSVLVDTYTIGAALEDYLPYRIENVALGADGEERLVDGVLALPVNPGSIRGAVRYADRVGPQVDRISIGVSGVADVFQAEADGSFVLNDLRAGIYSVTFTGSASGYRSVTVSPVVVAAGAETRMAETALPVAYGAVTGTLSLEEGDDLSEVLVSLVHEDGEVQHALVGDNGVFTFDAVRTGTYTATAHHPIYVDAREDGVSVDVDETTRLAFFLQVHRGSLRGAARPSDVDASELAMTATLQQTGETRVVDRQGAFEFTDLRPGVYTVSVSGDGHRDAQSLPVTVGPGEAIALDETLVLIDETAPDAPALVACDQAEPLPDFPDSPVYIPAPANESAPFRIRLGLENDPTEDPNFDPAAGRGEWQVRVNGGDWSRVQAGDFVRGAPGDACGDHFLVSVGAANALRTVEIRAEDADRNRSDSGIVAAVVDADAPAPFALGVPQGHCNPVDAAADAPVVQLPVGGRNGQPLEVRRDPVPTCHTSHDTVDLLIAPAALDPTFGCYFLYTRTLGNAESPTPESIQSDLLDDTGAVDLSNARMDTTACYAAGSQAVSVSPSDGQRTLYCVVGLDQSGRSAPFQMPQSCRGAPCEAGLLCNPRTFACETPLGTAPAVPESMLGCLIVNRDTAVPQTVDLLPDGVEITGGQVRLHTVGLPESRDPHFSRLEFRGGLYGPNWRTAGPAELTTFSDRAVLSLRVPAGETATLGVRAVDLAGNASDETEVTIEDRTQVPVTYDAAALGSTPGIAGERVAWVGPAQCDPQGQAKTCSHALRTRDESQLVPAVAQIGTLQSCAYDCPSEFVRTPQMVLLPRGLAYTHFVHEGATIDARLMYRTFGADGAPGTADDPAATEMGGAATFQGITALGANERQIAYATLTDPDRAVAGNETYAVRRFTVNELTGAADAEQTLTALPQRATITSAVVAVAPLAARGTTPAGTAFALADGSLWWWAQGAAAATALALPAITAAAGSTTRAMDLAGTGRYLVVAAQAFDANGAAVDAPAVALLLDFGSNGALDASERLTAPGAACQADADCGAGAPCVRPVAAPAGASAVRVGYTDLRCDGGRFPQFCGAQRFDLAVDADMLAYTDESLDADGLPTASLYVARLGAGLAQPRLVVTRQGHKSSPAVHLDRVVYVDEFANAPVVTVADPSSTGWVGLDARAKSAPRIGTDYVVWSSYESGTPATLTADRAPTPPLEGAELLVTVVEDGRTIRRTLTAASLPAGASVDELAALLNGSAALRDNGRVFLRASVAEGRLVLTTERVGADVSLTVEVTGDDEQRFGFTANRSHTGGDVWDPASGLFVAPINGATEPFALAPGAGSEAAVAQGDWAQGTHYDLAGSVLTAVERRPNLPPEVAFWPLRALATCRALAVPLEASACVNTARRAIATYAVAGTSVTDIATDGRYIVWGVLGAANVQGLWTYDTANPNVAAARITGSTQKCRLVGVTTVRPDGQANATVEVACISYQGANPQAQNDQYLTLYRKTGAQAWSGVSSKIPEGTGGVVTALLLDEYDLVIERQEDGFVRTAYRSAGPDGLFGPVGAAGTASDDLPDSDGVDNVFGNADDGTPFENILGRFGESLGRGDLRRGVYVYADAAALGQREIYRLRLRGRQVDRLSADGATQVQAAIGEGGVVFVDHRYTATANGFPLVPPALTIRRLP
jgi:hypothetical protein